MTIPYPIHFAAQLRQHLRAFRKARNLTQAQLGERVGVSQGRIAEIEANPGLVKFEQLMQILSAMDITLSLTENASVWPPAESGYPTSDDMIRTDTATYHVSQKAPQKTPRGGKASLSTDRQQRQTQTQLKSAIAADASEAIQKNQAGDDDRPTLARKLSTHPKKGQW